MDIINTLLYNLTFLFQRFTWLSVLDIALVTLIFFVTLSLLRDTQAVVLLRGVILLIVLLNVLNTLSVLPAFSWLIQTTLPSLLLAVPVIFAPEIRRALERLGRAGGLLGTKALEPTSYTAIEAIVLAAGRLARLKHGALIVLQRNDSLEEYIETGVYINAALTPELLLQIFYPNTPLHDGGVIIQGSRVVAASCVMPLSTSGVLSAPTEHKMGLRHRAGLGTSENSDAIVIVVSEETGGITLMHRGRMIRNLDTTRLQNILTTFFPEEAPPTSLRGWIAHLWKTLITSRQQEHTS